MRYSVVLFTLAALACNSREDSSQTSNDLARDTANVKTGFVLGAVTDANIFYLIDAAHVADSSTGALAATKGTGSEIRAFGTMMVRDHHMLREQAQRLSEKLAITPLPPPNDSSTAVMQRTMNTLAGAAKGRDFDKAYVDNEIIAHISALELLTAAMAAAQDPQLKFYIQKTAPVVLGHLDKIKQIQRALDS